MPGDKQRRKERDGGERRGELVFFLSVPTVRGRTLLPSLSLKTLPLSSSAAAIKTCSTFDLPEPTRWRSLIGAISRDMIGSAVGVDGHRLVLL